MTVVAVLDGAAICEVDGEARQVSTLLLGAPPRLGDHLLVHAETAMRVMDAAEAALVADALRAVMAAAEGRPFDHLIADLAEREPELPAHLRAPS